MPDRWDRLRRLLREMKRRKVFRVAVVYAGTAFVVLQAANLVFPSLAIPDSTYDVLVVLTLFGFPIAVVLAWAFEVTPEGIQRSPAERPSPREDGTPGDEERASTAEPAWLGARTAAFVGLLVLLGFALGAGWLEALVPDPAAEEGPAAVVRTSILPPPGTEFEGGHELALSRDGRRVAFVTDGPGSSLWIRDLDALDARPVPATEGATAPFWSPDGERVAFFVGGRLKVADLRRGGVRTLSEEPGGRGGTWSPEGVIVFAGRDGRLYRVSESGGVPEPVTERRDQPDVERPSFLPDGRRLLYSMENAVGVFVLDLESGESKRILERGGDASWAPPGWLLYHTPEELRTLFARRFDPDRLEFEGPPVPVTTDLRSPGGDPSYAVSETGHLVYLARSSEPIEEFLLVDRDGAVLDTLPQPDSTWQVRWSRGGDRLAFSGWALWIRRLDRPVGERIPTASTFVKLGPVWAPGDSLLAYWTRPSAESTANEIRAIRPDGTGSRLLADLGPVSFVPTDWSPDGRFLIGAGEESGTRPPGADLLDLEDGSLSPWRDGERIHDAVFHPRGRWIAYDAGEGERPEVYLAPYPGPGGRIRVSPNGGGGPRWRSDGRELFYVSADVRRLMAVEVSVSGGAPDLSTPRPVFPDREVRPGFDLPAIPGPDGDLFLFPNRRAAEGSGLSRGPLTFVQNWAAEMEEAGR